MPKPKAQRNFTGPGSKIMLGGDEAFHQCYHAQAVVDAGHQAIVATEMNTDAGFCSADNLDTPAATPLNTVPSFSSPPGATAVATRHR